jgi:hypothetical protein
MRPRPSEPFSAFLNERLGTLRFATVATLRALISQPPPSDIASLGFAVLDNPTEQFPIAVFASDQNGMPLTRENSSYINEVCAAFESLPPLYTEHEEDQFAVWETIDEGGPVHAIEQPMDGWEEAIFIPWFSDCWRRAGGADFARPATIEAQADARTILR